MSFVDPAFSSSHRGEDSKIPPYSAPHPTGDTPGQTWEPDSTIPDTGPIPPTALISTSSSPGTDADMGRREIGVPLNPNFCDLENPTTITSHVQELKKGDEYTPHLKVLGQLLEQLVPVDFELMAYPEVADLREQQKELTSNLFESDEANGDRSNADQNQLKEITKRLGRVKVSLKQYLVLSIEHVLDHALQNEWNLCKKIEFIYVFNGAHWSEVEGDVFKGFLGEASERMGVPRLEARHYEFRDKLLKQFLSTALLPAPDDVNNKVLINLRNGTFEIGPDGRRLRPFDANDFLTYQLPFNYDPSATAPRFEAYLNRVLPDLDSQLVLSEFIGYTFTGRGGNRVKEEKVLILLGTGANGKSVFAEIVNALLGSENVSSYSLQSLTDENGYYRAKIANKLVNYATEVSGIKNTGFFKNLASGEPVEARLPYGHPFLLNHYARLIFNCNELPKDVEHTEAYFRRFLIIPFNETIPEGEQDKELSGKIIDTELSGIFNWVLKGLDRLLIQKKFTSCDAARQAVEDYKLESDSVRLFLDDQQYQPSTTGEVPRQEVFRIYQSFCHDNGFKPCSSQSFGKRIRLAGFQTSRKNTGFVIHAEKKVLF